MSCCSELLGCRHSFQKGGILQAGVSRARELEIGGFYIYIYIHKLVDGLEHVLSFHILGIIIPSDVHIFQAG